MIAGGCFIVPWRNQTQGWTTWIEQTVLVLQTVVVSKVVAAWCFVSD